jgi:hypothetical protein
LSNGNLLTHRAAQYYSYIGEYAKALSVPNEVELAWGFDSLSIQDIQHFKQFHPVPALDELIKIARNNQILILNEAHHKPIHRVFVRSILETLYKQGYRYFGLEALSNCDYLPTEYCDTLLNTRGYPLNSPISGTYITEPQMSNLIIEAIELGFEVFAYEKFGKDRELKQAEGIYKILQKDVEAKILILCGWYHLLEENKPRVWMAQQLKELTGIDPFTIYQDILIERYCSPEFPLMKQLSYEQPTLFVNDQGQYYNGKEAFKKFDALLYHPRTRFMYNRPDWLVHYGKNKLFKPKVQGEKYPYLVKAFKFEFGINSVPYDIIELEYARDNTHMVLQPGKYVLHYINADRNVREATIDIKE